MSKKSCFYSCYQCSNWCEEKELCKPRGGHRLRLALTYETRIDFESANYRIIGIQEKNKSNVIGEGFQKNVPAFSIFP